MERRDEDPGVRWMLDYQGGDEAAFERIVHAYSDRVYALVTRFLGPVPGREDLVQEVFLRLIRARGRYRPTAHLSTWLYRIVFNLCVNERQRELGRAAASLEGEAAPPEPADERVGSPSDGLERDDVVGAVRRALAALPEQQRMALVLAKYEDLAYAQVAEVLGSTEKAVKSLVHRARENLRAALAPFLREEEPA